MKRLLAYLFLVLGLGLVFSVSANALAVYPSGPDRGACVTTSNNQQQLVLNLSQPSGLFLFLRNSLYDQVRAHQL